MALLEKLCAPTLHDLFLNRSFAGVAFRRHGPAMRQVRRPGASKDFHDHCANASEDLSGEVGMAGGNNKIVQNNNPDRPPKLQPTGVEFHVK